MRVMAYYATTEKTINCKVCFIRCTERELVTTRVTVVDPINRKLDARGRTDMKCPNCGELLIIQYVDRAFDGTQVTLK